MAITKYHRIILPLLLLFISLKGKAQIFSLQSLDHKKEEISLRLDLVNNEMKFLFKKQCITINGVTDLESKGEVIDNRFLKITYKVRGGSGLKIRRTILLCLNNDKLIMALHILSEYISNQANTFDREADSIQLFDEHSHYKVLFDFKSKSLNIGIDDEEKSKLYPIKNFSSKRKVLLEFDEKSGVFFEKKVVLNGEYYVSSDSVDNSKKYTLNDKVPTIILGSKEYYFLRNNWYEKGVGNYLFAYGKWSCN